jgi:hypothetical protein
MKLASIIRIAEALGAARVPFLVVGGVAVVAHGYGRSTQDLDLVVRLEPDAIRRTFAALASLGYRPIVPVTAEAFADERSRRALIDEKGMTVLHFHSDAHPETPIDLFATEPFDVAQERQAALVEEIAPGVALPILRLETLLRMKIEAGRPQDLADIAELGRIAEGHARER